MEHSTGHPTNAVGHLFQARIDLELRRFLLMKRPKLPTKKQHILMLREVRRKTNGDARVLSV